MAGGGCGFQKRDCKFPLWEYLQCWCWYVIQRFVFLCVNKREGFAILANGWAGREVAASLRSHARNPLARFMQSLVVLIFGRGFDEYGNASIRGAAEACADGGVIAAKAHY